VARNNRIRNLGVVLAVLTMPIGLTGCLGVYSGLYLDQRESISLHAGDAMASNKIAQVVDPWPIEARDRNIPGNGVRQQKAVERYRTDTVKRLHTERSSPATSQPILIGGASPGGSTAGQ
jgi:hypothetical protein